MGIFVHKPKATQQTTPANSTIPSRAHLTQSRDVNSILNLQRTIGNQAVRRLLQANAEDLETASGVTAANHFRFDFSQIPLYPPKRETVQSKLTINQPGDYYEREADRGAAQLMQLPVASVSSDSSDRAIQRKRNCAACQSGEGLCPQCAQEEKRVRRILTTTDMGPAIQGGIGDKEPVPMKDEPKKPPSEKKESKKEESTKKCLAETVTFNYAKCGRAEFGARAKYCYGDDPDQTFWHKEKVTEAPVGGRHKSCVTGVPVTQTGEPMNSGDTLADMKNCILDDIVVLNVPPSTVAPCTDATNQTVFIGPTKDTVEQCKYSHWQLIAVTVTDKDAQGKPTAGKVITTVQGDSGELKTTECDWTA